MMGFWTIRQTTTTGRREGRSQVGEGPRWYRPGGLGAGKLLEGLGIGNGQALPSFAPPFWVGPGPRAGLTDVAEMVRGT